MTIGMSKALALSSIAALSGLVFCKQAALAQDADPTPNPATPLVAEGVPDATSVTMDKKGRNPVVSIGTELVSGTGSSSHVKILADAYVPAEEYKNYPIEFKFFVNGTLRETQIRSFQLPRPVGIVVGTDVATPPFNWTVVATLLHPNRQFVTVAQGAVFARDLGRSYNCNLSLGSVSTEGGSNSEYVADEITAGQIGNSEISLNFTTSQLADGTEANELTATTTLKFSGTSASGTLTTTIDGRSSTSAVTGTTAGEGAVESFAVQSSDGLTKLECE